MNTMPALILTTWRQRSRSLLGAKPRLRHVHDAPLPSDLVAASVTT
jgi:hypothetical protein